MPTGTTRTSLRAVANGAEKGADPARAKTTRGGGSIAQKKTGTKQLVGSARTGKQRVVGIGGDDGGGALEAAEGLERFLSSQKKRVAVKTAKHEWLLGWQKLAEEAAKTERLLDVSLSSETLMGVLAEDDDEEDAGRRGGIGARVRVGTRVACFASLHSATFDEERVAMHRETSLLSAMVSASISGEASSDEVRGELDAAVASSRAQLDDIRQEEATVTRDLTAAWPSVLPLRAGSGLNEARADAERFHETLELILAAHPSAAHALREEVDSALEELEQRREARITRIEERERALREEATTSAWSRQQQHRSNAVTPVLQTVPQTTLTTAMGDAAASAASWLGARRRLAAARRSAAAMCQDERRHVVTCIQRLLVDMEAALAEARREQDEGARREERQRELQFVLESAREKRESAELDARRRQEEADARAHEEKARSDLAFLARLESQKALVVAFQRERLAMREAEEAQRREEERREREAVDARAGFHASRVSFRRGLLEERARCRRAEEEARDAIEKARVERLDAMAARVAVSAEKDPERLLHKTKALELREAATAASALFPVHGYSDDQLMRDEGFRVGIALREAGLHTSAYARTAMQTLAQPRRDTVHNAFGGA